MTRHVHIDALGGISGDMFAAAMLSLLPEAEAILREDLSAGGLDAHARLVVDDVRKGGFAARQVSFEVRPGVPPTHHWRDIRALLQGSDLRAPVKARAIAIFALLAEAEAASHAVAPDDVHFHEIADWDSVADITAAASLIETARATWSVGPLPLGGGRVRTRHGLVPLPAPATAELLKGFALIDDGVPGERVTPTGAAILRHLAPVGAPPPGAVLSATGSGAGQRDLPGLANLCRLMAFDVATIAPDRVAEIAFEIDDMTPEELATALERIRASEGVRDVGHTLGVGKKGRVRYGVQVLVDPALAEPLARLCLTETSTLGVRINEVRRMVLAREIHAGTPRRKTADRPGGATTKVEADDLAGIATLKARRRTASRAEHD